ncbi:hypothetical protein MKW98_023592 [Papaver atlanticum]|uniref:Uncharacterized protein n=1 Tax=Papaver atlanticum TaxID=357466 RepID=A0AAD4SZJ4_9MAGN|nr:hypothetical protein MKW98_023592 [Papaver atlanticum]
MFEMMKLVVMVRMSGGLIKFGCEDLGAKNQSREAVNAMDSVGYLGQSVARIHLWTHSLYTLFMICSETRKRISVGTVSISVTSFFTIIIHQQLILCPEVWVFFLCVVGITPLAEHLEYATKQLAYYMGLLICQEEIMPKVGSSGGRGRAAPSGSSGKTINSGGRASLSTSAGTGTTRGSGGSTTTGSGRRGKTTFWMP